MRKILAIAAFAVLVPMAGAKAQLLDAQRAELVGACLANVAGTEEEALFANLMTALMQQNEDNARTFRTALIARARELGIQSCNQPEDWFTFGWAGGALGYFIEGTLVRMLQEGVTWLRALP
jgi:hypothetical protein